MGAEQAPHQYFSLWLSPAAGCLRRSASARHHMLSTTLQGNLHMKGHSMLGRMGMQSELLWGQTLTLNMTEPAFPFWMLSITNSPTGMFLTDQSSSPWNTCMHWPFAAESHLNGSVARMGFDPAVDASSRALTSA
jgi:hypothetical protein